MGDANPICTLGDYSKPSHEGYRNTIELPVWNNAGKNAPVTAKLRNDILMFQQHHGESLSKAWTRFKDLLQKSLIMALIVGFRSKFFMIMSPFILNAKLTALPATNSAIRMPMNPGIIENLALYDHEGWNDIKEFVKPVKAIFTPQSTSKTPDRRLIELEDQINFLLKGSRPTPRSSSTHIPQAYVEAVYLNPRPFKNSIFKQREEINDRMTEMFELIKELTTSRIPKKVLIREEAKFPVTKNVNSISLAREEEERSDKIDVATSNDIEKPTGTEMEMQANKAKKKNEAGKEEMTEVPSSQPIEYYLKHSINKKLIKGLVDNRRFNDSLSGARVRKLKGETYNLSHRGLFMK
ncbi:hypothetical protein Tco_1046831 [Tanacetum coccineum]